MPQGKKNKYGLYPKQEAFAQMIAQGKNQAEAYRLCYDTNGSDKTVWVNASKTASNTMITQRVEMLRRQAENTAIWTRPMALMMLKEAAEEAQRNVIEPIIGTDFETGEKTVIGQRYNPGAGSVLIKAIEAASKMCGYNEPEEVSGKIEVIISDGAEDYSE